MSYVDPDLSIRMSAFSALDSLTAVNGPVLSWSIIGLGFTHRNQQIRFGNRPRGIFRPQQMRRGALSIKTTVPRGSRVARYDDQIASLADHFIYCFQGDDPNSRDNIALRYVYEGRYPIIYFYGVAPGFYRPLWPAFITQWEPEHLRCSVSVDDTSHLPHFGAAGLLQEDVIRRGYVTVQTKRRLHQDAFRALVLEAYRERCAVCRLPSAALLEAAHILPDRDERGRPTVSNGLALCRLHHGAFDRDLLGIQPDYHLEIAPSLLKLKDGPVLEQGLKAFHGKRLTVPRASHERPEPDYLAERYDRFKKAI